jgi:hypothetical protein
MRHFILACSLLFVSLLAGCSSDGGASDPAAGYEALQAGEYTDAVAILERALENPAASAEDQLVMAVARCQALAHIDAEKCKTDFLAIGSSVTAKDFSLVVADLVAEEKFLEAIDLLEAGVNRFAENPKMEQLKKLVITASKEDPEANAKLKGLGYI